MNQSKLMLTLGAVGAMASVVGTFGFSPMVTKIALCVAGCTSAAGVALARLSTMTSEDAGAVTKAPQAVIDAAPPKP